MRPRDVNLFDPALYTELRKPLDQAHGLPPACYFDEAFYQRELETIFHTGWVMVGRVERLPEPGSYFTAEFGATRLILTRAEDGRLHALANTCRHRGSPLLEGEGRCKTIACPYHAWTYGLDGKLLGAPGMKESLGFDTAEYPLHSARVDTWGGFIFVCLSPLTVPLASWLGDLPARLDMYGFEHMRTGRRVSYDVACNWKVWVENFMEGYHIPTVHRSTISRQKAVNIPEDPGRGEYTAIYERHEGTRALLYGDRLPAHRDSQRRLVRGQPIRTGLSGHHVGHRQRHHVVLRGPPLERRAHPHLAHGLLPGAALRA